MPVIKFNENVMPNFESSLTTNTGVLFAADSIPSTPNSTISGGKDNGDTVLSIYKGTKATFPSFTDTITRSADLLISFSLLSGTNSYTIISNNAINGFKVLAGVHLIPTQASASGTATWFLLQRSGTDLTTRGALIGDVGLVGSGADLEIENINIVAGNYYRCNGFYITFSTIYNF